MNDDARHAVLLAGGWAHPPDDLVDSMGSLLGSRGYLVDAVTDPHRAVDALTRPVDLLVVGSCWFSMADDRYSEDQRAGHAVHFTPELEAALTAIHDAGCPLLAMHTAVISFDGAPMWADWLGGSWNWARSWHPAPELIQVDVVEGAVVPIEGFSVVDELYQGLDVGEVEIVAQSFDGDPLIWTNTTPYGRAGVDLLGHDARSLRSPGHLAALTGLLDWVTASPAQR